MTSAEFAAWFEGYTKAMRGKPNAKQWQEITAKIAGIDANAPLKAWFDGFTAKIKHAPNDGEWRKIKDYVASEQARAGSKKGRLQGLFESFEEKASTMRGDTEAKTRKK